MVRSTFFANGRASIAIKQSGQARNPIVLVLEIPSAGGVAAGRGGSVSRSPCVTRAHAPVGVVGAGSVCIYLREALESSQLYRELNRELNRLNARLSSRLSFCLVFARFATSISGSGGTCGSMLLTA